MVVCRQCGRADVPGTLYCQNCGASLEQGERDLFRSDATTPGAANGGNGGNSGNGAHAAPQPGRIATRPSDDQGPHSGDLIVVNPFTPTGEASRQPQPQRHPQRQRPTARIAIPPSSQRAPKPAPIPAEPAAPAAPPYAIPAAVELRLPNGHIFLLSGKQEYRIGRRDIDQQTPPDVDFTDWNGAAAGVSRDHLGISVTPDGVFVEDHESTNNTLCNGARLHPHQQYLLKDRDELRLGTIMLRVLFVYTE